MIHSQGLKLLLAELQSNEKILWEGQPNPAILFNRSDLFLIPFSLIWFSGIFSVGKEMIFSSASVPFPFSLIPILFFFIGLYMCVGRFIYKYLKKKKTFYGVTNQRVLVVSEFLGKSVQATYIKDIPTINKSINSKGIGSIIFGNQNMQSALYSNTGMDFFNSFNGEATTQFYDISDAENVYKIVCDLKDQ